MSKRGCLSWLWLSILVVLLDQAIKYWAVTHLTLHEPVAVLPFFNLTLIYNSGAAFSFLAEAGGWQRWFFVVLTVLVSSFLLYWLSILKKNQIWLAAALALIIGGAIGNNLIDRLFLGYVIDFIDVYYQRWHWPAFNIADSAITIGAAIAVIEALFFEQQIKE